MNEVKVDNKSQVIIQLGNLKAEIEAYGALVKQAKEILADVIAMHPCCDEELVENGAYKMPVGEELVPLAANINSLTMSLSQINDDFRDINTSIRI